MNKVFKVIWSKTKNCYVVASELAKSHTKAPSAKGISRVLACGVLACVLSCGAVMPVIAAGNANNINADNDATITGADVWEYLQGSGIGLAGGNNASAFDIVIGKDATTNSTASAASIVIGKNAQGLTGNTNLAIGTNAVSDNYAAIAIGTNAVSKGRSSVALGDGIDISGGSSVVAVGTSIRASGNNAVALGHNTYVKNGGIAIGDGAVVQGMSNIAFGRNSVASGGTAVVSVGHKAGDTYYGVSEMSNTDSFVSNYTEYQYEEDFFRKIINVGDGTSANEAATVGQTIELVAGDNVTIAPDTTATNSIGQKRYKISAVGGGGSTPYVGINSATGGGNEDGSGAVGEDSIAIGKNAAAKDVRAVAIGFQAQTGKGINTNQDVSIALGYKAKAVGQMSDDTDTGREYSSIAIGSHSDAENKYSVAFGHYAIATGDSSIAIGRRSGALKLNSLALGNYSNAEAGRDVAIGNRAATKGAGSVAIGESATAEKSDAVVIGISASSNDAHTVSVGGQSKTLKDYATSIGSDANAKATQSTAIGAYSVAYEENTVSFGHARDERYSSELNRRLVHVADGAAANDVATVGQTIELVAGDNVTVVPDDTATNSIGQKRYKISATSSSGASYSAGNNISIENNIVSATGLIKYDNEDKDIASLEGVRGTKLTNLKAGALTQSSTDAVIGNQLWAVKQDIIGFASDINRNKANITTLNQSVTDALSSVSAVSDLVDAIDSLKADASLNNLTNQGRAIIATAAADAVQAYMAEHGGSTGNTQTRMMSRSLGAVNPGADTNYVVYDDADSTSITLEGPVGEGTKLTGLAEAELSASSTDAVTGGQLYAVEQRFNDFQSALSENNSTIATMQTSLNTLKTKTLTMESDLNTAKTQLETGFNVTVDGAKVKTVNPEANFIDFKKGDNISIIADGDAVKISAVATGTVAEGDTGLVSGDTVYQAIKDLGAGDVTQDDLKNYAKKDASNVAEHAAAWGEAIGTGVVEQDNGELVTGGTVFTAIGNAVSDLQDVIDDKANADLDNLTDAGKDAVKDLAKDAVKVEGKGAAKVTSAEKDGAMVYTVNVETNGKVEEGNTGIVTGGTVYEAINDIAGDIDNKADKDLGNITDDGKEVIREAVQGDLEKKADKDSVYTKEETDNKLDAKADKADLNKKADKNGANITNPEKWAEKLGIGAVEEGNGNLVTGDTVAKALAEIDGSDLIDQNGEAIQIGAKAKYDGLDSVDISKSDGSGRVLRGVLVDPDDDKSAANVGYVKATAETIVQGVNAGLVKLDDKINKTGASAAAMANLHPVENDGDQRWNVAVGVGTFHGSTAGAVGVFYKPNENTMVNVSTSFGSENMFGAGVAFAIDKPTTMSLSKVQMARVINNQAEKLDSAIQVINKQQAQLDAQSRQIAELQAAVKALRK